MLQERSGSSTTLFGRSQNVHVTLCVSRVPSNTATPQMTLQHPYPVFSCYSWANEPIPVHSLIMSFHLFLCLPLLVFLFTVLGGAMVGRWPAELTVGAGGVCLDFFLSSINLSLLLSPSLWETVRFRLKYCLKGPLSSKQPTNQLCTAEFSLLNLSFRFLTKVMSSSYSPTTAWIFLRTTSLVKIWFTR